jgi:hypothetical protein
MISTLSSMNLKKHIPVGNSDAGSYFSNLVLEAAEYGVRFSVLLKVYSEIYCSC